MPVNGQDNFSKLDEAGLILDPDMPDQYKLAIEGLTKQEVNILIAVKKRLDHAGHWHQGSVPSPGQPGHFTTFMLF